MASTGNGLTPAQRDREDELVREHLALVTYAVNEMASRVPGHVCRGDLVSAGMEGLAQAARSFEESRGVTFDRYASTRIKGALLDELRRRDWASRSVRSRARQINSVTDALTASLGRAPTVEEIADAAHLTVRMVRAVCEDVHRAVVLDFDALTTQADGDEVVPSDANGPDAILLERERQSYLLDAVAALPVRLRRVVVGYFFEERPMQQLARELGVTESRISQMRAEALLLLKDGINSQLDPDQIEAGRPDSRRAKRRAAYYEAVAGVSDYRTRLSDAPRRLDTVLVAHPA